MLDTTLIPGPVVTLAAVAAVFLVMFSLGLASQAGELRWALGRPGLVARALVTVLVLVIWKAVLGASPATILAIVLVTVVALTVGHAMGAPAADTRTAVAMASAIRNPGLALLVAAANSAAPELIATVMACALWSAVTVTPYAVWRAKAARRANA